MTGRFHKMASITRSSILGTLLAAVLLITLPGAILRIVHTGDFYLFTRDFFDDMLARLSGASRLRFLLRPAVTILLGSRDGVRDARIALPSYLWALAFHGEHRRELLRGAFASIREVVAVAILLDILSQFLIFRDVHPGAAILLGPVLIGVPYVLSRVFANRLARSKSLRAHSTRAN